MTAEQYKAGRKKLGTQVHVASLLDVSILTIKRREKPGAVIPREAALAMEFITKPLPSSP